MAMVLVPAMHSGDARVFLWGRSNVASPLHIFTGHSETVLEVQWRRYKGGMLHVHIFKISSLEDRHPGYSLSGPPNNIGFVNVGCHEAYT